MIAPREISDHRVRRIIQLIEAHPKHRVKELAEVVNLSASRLEHLFKEETGHRLSLYIQDQKLEKARDLLLTTGMQVKEISFNVGYEHAPSFVRAFKGKFSLTPKDYRGLNAYRFTTDNVVN